MSNSYHIDDFSDIMLETVANGGEVIFRVRGISMVPLLLDRRDSVVLKAMKAPLKVNDVPFCKMDSGKYILHRVRHLLPDGKFIMRGDNNHETETASQSNVIAVACAFIRKGKRIECSALKYKLYCFFLPIIRPLWRGFWKIADFILAKRNK